ncbi:Serine incorporator [Zostera marina]|uniref:Serine incorporator n=1 Tax=Zostera marina TaxID=29655 RepID=A0A0K9PZ35_ZOSMR|nr:Serine incorporator [Zostera marina]
MTIVVEEGTITREDHHGELVKTPQCLCSWSTGIARYIYALIFLTTNLLAWMVRDYGRVALSKLRKNLEMQGFHSGKECLGSEGVLRISLGCFLFFFVMFVSTVGTRQLGQRRNSWHSSWWSAKIILWMIFMIFPFIIPSDFVLFYGKIAHLGAGIFLFIQLISVISLITLLNDYFRMGNNAERCRIQVLFISITAYIVALLFIILMYIWYAPNPSCKINIFFITMTLALIQLTTFVSTLDKVNAGFLTPGLMAVYLVFICWCAIRSEPHSENCNKNDGMHSNLMTYISFVVAVLVIVVATFTTGIDSKCFQMIFYFKKVKTETEDVPYGYGFFHFVFAMGANYFAMLFISWNTHHTMEKWTIDVGWASTWVRVVNQWLSAVVYLWTIVAPLFWKNLRCPEPQEG